MAIPVLETDWNANNSGGSLVTSIVLTKPTGTAVDDVLVILVGDDAREGLPHYYDTPTGFTEIIASGDGTSDAYIVGFYRVADGTEGTTITVTHGGVADALYGWYMRVSGADTTTPINASLATVGAVGLTYTTDGVTTDEDDCLILGAVAYDGGNGGTFVLDSGAGWSIVDQENSGTGNNNSSGVFLERDQATSGAGVDFVLSASQNDGWAGIQFAIQPPTSSAQTITGAVFTNTNTFGAGTISQVGPDQTITGANFANIQSFGAGTVSQAGADQTITGVVFSNTQSFGAGVISQVGPDQTITGVSYTNTQSFGSGEISQTIPSQTITGVTYTNTQSFGAGTVTQIGPDQTITGAVFTNSQSFGAGIVSQSGADQTIIGASFVNAQSFGAGTITQGISNQTIAGEVFINLQSFGAGVIVGGYTGNPNGGKRDPIKASARRRPVVGRSASRTVTGRGGRG